MKKELTGMTIFGAVLAALLTASAIEAVAARLFEVYEMRVMAEKIEGNLKDMGIRPISPPAEEKSQLVPGKTVLECNELTGGLLNDEWKRCRSGYIENP